MVFTLRPATNMHLPCPSHGPCRRSMRPRGCSTSSEPEGGIALPDCFLAADAAGCSMPARAPSRAAKALTSRHNCLLHRPTTVPLALPAACTIRPSFTGT